MNYDARRAKALERLGDSAKALLVSKSSNVRYLTGFTGSNAQLLLTPDPVFFTDGRYDEQSADQVKGIERQIYSASLKFTDLLSKALGDHDVAQLGVEATHMTLDTEARWREALKNSELVRTTGIVEGVRQRKDADEIEAIRSAQRIAERALESALRDFETGTEVELALAIEWAMRTSGSDGIAFEVIVASGPHSALPHASPRPQTIDRDGVLLIDMGARVDGYCSDMTRTYLGPKAMDPLPKVHDAVVRALDAACQAVRPGAECSAVDAAARESLDRDGYAEAFVHSTGHSVGLEVHEDPAFRPTSEAVLEPGMVVTIEPGVYLPGIGGVRVEDLLVVTDGGCENLTELPRGPDG